VTETDGLDTPAAVIDLERVRRNAERVVDYARRHGLAWRPHVKTHKSVRLARLQVEAGARGLTVATPREAEVMSRVSDDLLLAYPPVGEAKLRRLLALPPSVRLTVALDTRAVLEDLAEAARAVGRTVGVLVELDAGLRRVGVPTPGDAVALARRARELEGVEYRGLLFYPGQIRMPVEEQDEALEKLAECLQRFYEALGEEGLDPPVVSGGSTPTLWRSHELPGLTEIRPGTCIFNDRDARSLGAARDEDLAYTVLATVVSDALPGQVVVDAGSKALAKEAFRAGGEGYGVLLDRLDVRVARLSEEHGVLDLSRTSWRPKVGERVRIVPNHVCVSVNLQEALYARGPEGLERIDLEARGREPSGG